MRDRDKNPANIKQIYFFMSDEEKGHEPNKGQGHELREVKVRNSMKRINPI